MADMLSDWKGYWPDILKQPGENTEKLAPMPVCGPLVMNQRLLVIEVWFWRQRNVN